ncbi:MAG: hypothetical protein JWO44_2164 [Bacteroidetes bacterium]|nr:hypothetical protein [Bacteroidota bacterium]
MIKQSDLSGNNFFEHCSGSYLAEGRNVQLVEQYEGIQQLLPLRFAHPQACKLAIAAAHQLRQQGAGGCMQVIGMLRKVIHEFPLPEIEYGSIRPIFSLRGKAKETAELHHKAQMKIGAALGIQVEDEQGIFDEEEQFLIGVRLLERMQKNFVDKDRDRAFDHIERKMAVGLVNADLGDPRKRSALISRNNNVDQCKRLKKPRFVL